MTTNTYKCPKCSGSGYLSCYAGIAGGVCFSCKGAGLKEGKPPVPGKKFAVSAVLKETGERLTVCYLRAKTSEEAASKARAQLARGNGYFSATAEVLEAA